MVFFFLKFRTRENKAYHLDVQSKNISVYCVMDDTGMGRCGGDGWTLVMKIDGTKVFHPSFNFDSFVGILAVKFAADIDRQ